jgi:hypothetical protein
MSKRISLILAGLLGLAVACGGQTQAPAPVVSGTPDAVPAQSVISTPADSSPGRFVIPVNTTIPLELRNTLSSRTAQPGQAIYCVSVYPITVKNRIVIPVGTYVKGQVTQVTRPGRVKGKAELAVRFDEITLANGVTKPLRASLSGFGSKGGEGFNPKEGKIQGPGTKGKDAETVAISAGEGAGIGAVAGISSGHSGLGAGAGGGAGALGGLVYVLASRGKDVVLPAGTSLELSLALPLSYDEDELQSASGDSPGPDLGRRDPGPGL